MSIKEVHDRIVLKHKIMKMYRENLIGGLQRLRQGLERDTLNSLDANYLPFQISLMNKKYQELVKEWTLK